MCNQVNLGEVIREVAASMTPRTKAKNIKLKTAADGELTACVDRGKLQNILRQLLDNAIKFTDKGGKIEVSAEKSGDEITVIVKDDGPGIESENLLRVFDCFAKYEAPASAGSAGVGLGLTLAKKLVEMQGGRIWAQSTVGEGTTFRFNVPK